MNRRVLWRMWWSGVFATAMAVHVLRALSGVPVVVGSVDVPLWVSSVVVLVAGSLSAWLGIGALYSAKM